MKKLLTALALLAVCHTGIAQLSQPTLRPAVAVVKPPIPRIDAGYQQYAIPAETGGRLNYRRTQTTLDVPPAAFVYPDGKPATGTVTVLYREFHTTAEVARAGIPMQVSAGGDTIPQLLQTQGMMEIRALDSQGNTLALAPGKEIGMGMTAYRDSSATAYYRLNEQTGLWVPEEKAVTIGPRKRDTSWFIQKSRSYQARLDTREERYITVQLYRLNIPPEQIPELAEIDSLEWRYGESDGDTYGNDPALAKNKWVLKHPWTSIQVSDYAFSSDFFEVTLLDSKTGKRFMMLFVPTAQGAAGKRLRAILNERGERFKRTRQEARQLQQPKTTETTANTSITITIQVKVRTFSISSLGYHNWDVMAGLRGLKMMQFFLRLFGTQEVIEAEYVIYIELKRDVSIRFLEHRRFLSILIPVGGNYDIRIIIIDKNKKIYVAKQKQVADLADQYQQQVKDLWMDVMPTRHTSDDITAAEFDALLKP